MENRNKAKTAKTTDGQVAGASRPDVVGVTKRWSWDFYVCIAMSIGAFFFILYRIFNVSFSMDEWGMWKDSIRPGLEALITFQQQIPQSHFFEGLFAMPFLKYLPFEPAESTRIPSLLMLPVYVWSGMYLAKRQFANSWLRLVFFGAWLCPQIIIEYFGMARGYAFLMALSGASFVGLIEAYNPKNTDVQQERWTKLSILSACLAMLSVLTFSYGYFMVSFLLLLRYYLNANGSVHHRIGETLHRGSFVVWTGIALVIFYLPRYLILRHSSSMQWGGTSGFVADSFSSLLECIAYIPRDVHNIVHTTGLNAGIVYTAFGLCLLDAVLFLVQSISGRKSLRVILQSPFAISSTLFFGIALLMQVLFWLFGMQFPTRRTTLYLWPILVMLLGFSINEYKSVLLRMANGLALIVVIANSFFTYNTNMILETNGDYQNKEITRALCALAKDMPPGKPMFVGVTDCMRYTIWYYLEYEHGLKPVLQFENHPVFKMFGDNKIFLYSLSYGYPQPFPPIWHHFPFSPDYYLLSPYEPGQQPNPRLMDMTPVYECKKSRAAIYKAKPPEGPLGCDVNKCFVCQALYQMAGQQEK